MLRSAKSIGWMKLSIAFLWAWHHVKLVDQKFMSRARQDQNFAKEFRSTPAIFASIHFFKVDVASFTYFMLLEAFAFIIRYIRSGSFSYMTHHTHASNSLSIPLATPFILSRRVHFKHIAIHHQSLPHRIFNLFSFRDFFISLPSGLILLIQIPMNVEGTIQPSTPWLARVYGLWV